MNPVTIVQASFHALDGILKIISEIRAQGGMTDDEIMAHAQASGPANAALIKQYMDGLPPAAPAPPAPPAPPA